MLPNQKCLNHQSKEVQSCFLTCSAFVNCKTKGISSSIPDVPLEAGTGPRAEVAVAVSIVICFAAVVIYHRRPSFGFDIFVRKSACSSTSNSNMKGIQNLPIKSLRSFFLNQDFQ